jgi:hypothetical protein
MPLQCPNCNHVACNRCARENINRPIGHQKPFGSGSKELYCCICNKTNLMAHWIEVKDSQPRTKLVHPDLFGGVTKMGRKG